MSQRLLKLKPILVHNHLMTDMLQAHGDKAEGEAAQKVVASRKAGQEQEAQQWDQVRKAINLLRSGHVS